MDKWVRVGSSSSVCDQLAQMSGCLVPENTIGFVRYDYIGPRGPVFERQNPVDPNLSCHRNRKAVKIFCG